MVFTETMLNGYAAPLSESEDKRCQNAINMVRDALRNVGYTTPETTPKRFVEGSYAYTYNMSIAGGRDVKLLVQGSYANNTNVKQNSDVDIAVILESTFNPKYRSGVTGASYGFTSSADNLPSFKDDVEKILIDYFKTGVERKNKSIKINGNSYRVDADTVPCMRHRDYTRDYLNNPENFVPGIKIVSDMGEVIYNYPEQHILNGRSKNISTNHLYKKYVRIMKKMRYIMEDLKIDAAGEVSSFALESLLWNIPDSWYNNHKDYRKVFTFDRMIDYLLNEKDNYSGYLEANGIKKLCMTQSDCEKLYKFIQALRRLYRFE